jgi:Ti-type conjugative transfer relaxase TraA
LPHELSAAQRLEATRALAQDLANRYGAAVDFAIHAPHEASDIRNHHAHLLMTTRRVSESGLGEKTLLERENKWLLSQGLPTTDRQLRELRQAWEGIANERLAAAGLDLRIDHRSHQERGLELAPTEHMGVHATQMDRRGLDVTRGRLDGEAARRNGDLIREKPEQVLTLITGEKSVFDRRDVARTLHRYLNEDAREFQNAFARVMASPALVELQPERVDPETGQVEPARYSTREMVEIETGMIQSARRLREAGGHGVDRRHVERALDRQDGALRRGAGGELSEEQRRAIAHLAGQERISAVVGFAGAGKSTMLAAAREAWEAQGYSVHGAALSGKAAEGLEEASGIGSRTLASWSLGWESGRGLLAQGDVLVIDEAGMIGSRQLARFVAEVEARGAKLVLVGDHEQLQAIGAGAPFRAIAEEIGHVGLSEIRRQRADWQREASVRFATHRTAEGLSAYRERGDIVFSETSSDARREIVRDYLADREERPEGTRVAMAHRRADVRAINAAIRTALQERGELALGGVPASGSESGALIYQTHDGKREFAPGDRIVFLENNRDLGVKNGMLGTVEQVEAERIVARLDGRDGKSVDVPISAYQAIDHGYATTIHKNQGATVDRSFVLASATMDRHLTYVAMTRHRDGARLYASREEFGGRQAGRLVAHGAAPFEHDPRNSGSYFVTLETGAGERRTIWGVDLERVMTERAPALGDMIALRHQGSVPVNLPDGTQTHRNVWTVQDAEEAAYRRLEERLSRSGVKETTLDYTRGFAERRGLAESLGVRSEIALTPASLASLGAALRRERGEERAGPGRDRAEQGQGAAQRERLERAGEDEAPIDRKSPKQAETQRGLFAGLKLHASPSPAREPGPGDRPEREGGQAERPDPLAERARRPSPLEAAVDRYARAYQSIDQHRRAGLPVLDMQRRELGAAGGQLDQVHAGLHDLMRSTLANDPATVRSMSAFSGRERVLHLIQGLTREGAALQDPAVRAERYDTRWRALQEQRQTLHGPEHSEARAAIDSRMAGLAKAIESDPQADAILRSRAKELGQEPRQGQSVEPAQRERKDRSQVQRQGRGMGLSR